MHTNLRLQLAGFLDNSLVNGPGLRSVVFVSGCRHNCEGCHNKEMQDFDYGDSVSVIDVFKRIEKNSFIVKGVTFSGGEPFEKAKELAELSKYIKNLGLNLWSYSGYTYEYIMENINSRPGWKELMDELDVLIDGEFDKGKTKDGLKYRGSFNQRIIDVKKSKEEGKIIIID